LTHKTVSVKVS